jgi:TDP-4-keto-6-deoxy-D-glucose transaminase
MKIPFNKPALVGTESEYLSACIRQMHISGDGIFTKKCHALLEESLQVGKALLTTSCTHALEMTAMLIDLQPGDEVIVPSFSFVSTVNAYVLRGAKPVFADIRPDTLNLDETKFERLITPKTKAVVTLHYGGVGCEMDAILSISEKYGIIVIEDNAHGLFGKYKGRCLGSFGAMATLSFHETKNFSCGEGGALLINDLRYVERAEIIREKGTDRSLFFRGQVDKYSWVDIGSSYLPSDLLAAYLFAQLEARERIQSKRREIWLRYFTELKEWAEDNKIGLPFVPKECEQSYHIFYLLMPSFDERQDLIRHLKEREILAVFHYLPLHLSKMGVKFGGRLGDCPVTESVSDRLLRLPFYYSLTEDEQFKVIEALKEWKL